MARRGMALICAWPKTRFSRIPDARDKTRSLGFSPGKSLSAYLASTVFQDSAEQECSGYLFFPRVRNAGTTCLCVVAMVFSVGCGGRLRLLTDQYCRT